MTENYYQQFIQIIKGINSPLEDEFIARIKQHHISRSENITNHICCFFAAIDVNAKKVFIGLHKNSGLWLFNGGHLEPNELPIQTINREMTEEWGYAPIDIKDLKPELLSMVEIENKIQACKKHFDIWFFIRVDEKTFSPNESLLKQEFFQNKWLDLKQAKKVCHGQYSLLALEYIQHHIFNRDLPKVKN
jgi:8-oxo-dGTP pyrophosphatase MutT (NUDIX family)